jgi:hypothetical protein
MNKLHLFVIALLAIGTITSIELTITSVIAQTLTSTLTGEKEINKEISNAPKGMKNMSFSPNDVRNETFGMDNSPAFDNSSAGSIDLKINQ